MTTYERIFNTVEAEVWDGTPEGLERLVRFTDRKRPAGSESTVRGVEAVGDQDGPALMFYCARAETVTYLRVGGAVAAERDGSGFYPIAPDVLAADFRPVAAADDDVSSPAAHDVPEPGAPVTDDELEAALAALEADQ